MRTCSRIFLAITFVATALGFLSPARADIQVFPPKLPDDKTDCPAGLSVLAYDPNAGFTHCLSYLDALHFAVPLNTTLGQPAGQYVMSQALPGCTNGQYVVATDSGFQCFDPVFTKCSNDTFVIKGGTCPTPPPKTCADGSIVTPPAKCPVKKVCPTTDYNWKQDCPAGYQGEIDSVVQTNCDGTTTTLPDLNSCQKVGTFTTVNTQTCNIGDILSGYFASGVFNWCGSDLSLCHNYLCTENGLVQQ